MRTKVETPAMKQAKEDLIEYMIWWLDEAARFQQSPGPISFGAVVMDDVTVRDLVEMARGRKSR